MIQSALICSPRESASIASDAKPSSVTATQSSFFQRLIEFVRSTSIKLNATRVVARVHALLGSARASRVGDRALATANFFFVVKRAKPFGEGAEWSTRGA